MTLTEEIEKLKMDIKKSLENLEQEDLTIDTIEGYIRDAYSNLNTVTDLLKKLNGRVNSALSIL